MKFLIYFFVIAIFTISTINGQGSILDLFNPFAGSRGKMWQCPFQRCLDEDIRYVFLRRALTPEFPHYQQRRLPNTHYHMIATNIGSNGVVEALLSRPGAFLAYDSKFDPIYDPCRDCEVADGAVEHCGLKKCYIERTYLIGRN